MQEKETHQGIFKNGKCKVACDKTQGTFLTINSDGIYFSKFQQKIPEQYLKETLPIVSRK